MHFRWPQQLAVYTNLTLSKDRPIRVTQTCMYTGSSKCRPGLSWTWSQTPFKIEIGNKIVHLVLPHSYRPITISRAGTEKTVRDISVWHKCNSYSASWGDKSVLALLEFNSWKFWAKAPSKIKLCLNTWETLGQGHSCVFSRNVTSKLLSHYKSSRTTF